MARLLKATGLTASAQIGVPAPNIKWCVKYALLTLVTSATAGTRSGFIQWQTAGKNSPSGILAVIPAQTGVSTTYTSIGSPLADANVVGGSIVQWTKDPEIFATDVLYAQMTLVAGDTFEYEVMIEERQS